MNPSILLTAEERRYFKVAIAERKNITAEPLAFTPPRRTFRECRATYLVKLSPKEREKEIVRAEHEYGKYDYDRQYGPREDE